MPPIPPAPGAPAAAFFSSSLSSATSASVVSIRPAMDAAFCSARRVTLAGSMTPIFTISPYSPVSALKPKFSSFDSRILPITTAPSEPALSDGLKDARVNLLAADDRGAPAHRVGEELRNSRGLRRHGDTLALDLRSEEHTSELQSL